MPQNNSLTHTWYNAVQLLVSQPIITRLLSKVVGKIDRPILQFTRGHFSVSGWLAGWPVINLTTIGAKTKLVRTNPVLGILDGEKYILIASNYGRSNNPAWYYNIKTNPEVTVTHHGRISLFLAHEASPDEYQHCWELALEAHLGFAIYMQNSSRSFPIIILEPRSTEVDPFKSPLPQG